MSAKRRIPLLLGLFIISGGILVWVGYRRLPSVQDKKAQPLWLEAQAREQREEFAQAVAFYRQLSRSYPQSSFCIQAERRVLDILESALYDWEGLVEECQWWLKKFPSGKEAPEILCKLGSTQLRFLLNFPAAEQCYQKILKKYPASNYRQKALLGLSDLYYRQGRWRELIALSNQVLQENKIGIDKDLLHFRNAQAYYRLKRYAEAKEQFAQISNQQSPRIADCLEYYQTGVAVSPASAEAHESLGDFYARRGNFRLAHQEWRRASAIRNRERK